MNYNRFIGFKKKINNERKHFVYFESSRQRSYKKTTKRDVLYLYKRIIPDILSFVYTIDP